MSCIPLSSEDIILSCSVVLDGVAVVLNWLEGGSSILLMSMTSSEDTSYCSLSLISIGGGEGTDADTSSACHPSSTELFITGKCVA